MAIIYAYKNRGFTKDFQILKADSSVIIPQSNDKIRAVVGRVGRLGTALADAQFSVDSDADTDNGSSFSKNSPTSGKNRLRIDASDLTFDPGVYTLFLDYFDNADVGEWKNVDRQIFILEDT